MKWKWKTLPLLLFEQYFRRCEVYVTHSTTSSLAVQTYEALTQSRLAKEDQQKYDQTDDAGRLEYGRFAAPVTYITVGKAYSILRLRGAPWFAIGLGCCLNKWRMVPPLPRCLRQSKSNVFLRPDFEALRKSTSTLRMSAAESLFFQGTTEECSRCLHASV